MAEIEDLDVDLNALPENYRQMVVDGTAIIPSHISSHDFSAYLEALDEKVLREVFVRVGLNGNSRVILVAVLTNDSERRRFNFPNFKMDKEISDYIEELPEYTL